MQDPVGSFPFSPLGFAIFFVTFWCLICFLISLFSGWFALSRRFRKQSEPYGETRTAGPFFYTIYTRFWSHYSNVVRLTAADDALYFSIMLLFRVGHPPLKIPWTEITFGRTKYFWKRYVVMKLGNEEQIPMRISERMARSLGIAERFLGENASGRTESRAQPLPLLRYNRQKHPASQ